MAPELDARTRRFAPAAGIAEAVLYEGYVLYPYRPSAIKNQRRWTFGRIVPRIWAETARDGDPWAVRTELLIRGLPASAVSLCARFLHVLQRDVDACPDAWEEAREREITALDLGLGELARGARVVPIAIAAGEEATSPAGGSGGHARRVTRRHAAIEAVLEASAVALGPDSYRLTIRLENLTPMWPAELQDGAAALARTLVAAHVIVAVEGGAIVSVIDPPAALAAAAAACRQEGLWPVLLGAEGEAACALAAPIILYDHPRIAPESPGELFDATEIDEMLALRILTLTEAEKREMAAADPRTAAMLARTEALGPQGLLALHGTWRSDRRRWRPGDRVRLRPRGRADVFDIVLAGMAATIEAVEEDLEGRIHLAVTVDADPGRDFGRLGQIGHRFFFGADEVEPLDGTEAEP